MAGSVLVLIAPLFAVRSPEAVAEWFEAWATDGFILMFPTLPASLNGFVELVVPGLCRRRLFREDYDGATSRENLGLSMSGQSLCRYAGAGQVEPA